MVVMGKHIPQLEVLDVLLGDKPLLEPKMRMYHRLIASDDEGATDLAVEYLKEMSLEELYDRILMPALADSQRDREMDALDERRALGIRQTIRELVETMGERQPKDPPLAAPVEAPDGPTQSTPLPTTAPASLPQDLLINVLCLPAHDEADEIAGLMLAQLLERRGFHAKVAGAATLTGEMPDLIEKANAEIVIVSALPPRAAPNARYLLKRLALRYPQLKPIVGLWTSTRDGGQKPRADFGSAVIATSLAEAQMRVDQFIPQIAIDHARTA
jgi:hypothetical protein